jgi:hypothetical protein
LTPTGVLPRGQRSGISPGARAVLFAAGFAVAIWLVRSAGATQVLAVLRGSGRWLLLVVLLEAVCAVGDAAAARVLLGSAARAVTGATWIRATAAAYASTILLPAGRLAGEAARATSLAGCVGAAAAVGACTRLQACALLANATISLACLYVALRSGVTTLAGAIGLNALACGVLGAALLVVLRSGRAATWLRGRFAFLADIKSPSRYVAAGRLRTIAAESLCVGGRCVQAMQYGVVVLAVGGVATPATALTAQGIHLVGAAAGDAIPGQLGAIEGSYRVFAAPLGFEGDLTRALSIPLVVRIAQLGLAVTCLLVLVPLRRQPPIQVEA